MAGKSFNKSFNVAKVDTTLGLVFGWAIVCEEDGEDYFDKQGDHITPAAMLESATDYMLHARTLGDMHESEDSGMVVFCFPLTQEIAKAFDLDTRRTGLMVAAKPSPSMLKRFQDGELRAFSIGGMRVEDEDIDE